MQKQFIRGYFKKEGDNLVIVASDETLDRHGEVLKISAWDLSEFKKAPRILVDHDHRVESIVGKASDIWIEDNKLLFTPIFHEITQLSREVKEMVEQGFLDTVSVGFIPHGAEKDGDSGRNELIEISFVTVGANPNARAKALHEQVSKATASDEEKALIEKFTGQEKCVCEKCGILESEKKELVLEIKLLNDKLSARSAKLKSVSDRCEKLQKALTDASNKTLQDDTARVMLKEVARVVNQSLYKVNKR